jgi:hypothetical protein
MNLQELIERVELARTNFIDACSGLTREEANYKTSDASWSITEIAEHIVRADWGGPIEFWLINSHNCKRTLEETCKKMEGLDPERIIYPHPISGPLNVCQRMEFLRYHMERHQRQIENIKQQFNQERT